MYTWQYKQNKTKKKQNWKFKKVTCEEKYL